MITLLKNETRVKAVRDVCLGKKFLPKGWVGRITAITKNDEGTPALFVRGDDGETHFYLDPRDFSGELPQDGETKLLAHYYDGRGDIWGVTA